MKYMTFNASCAFAGVANMLEQYGVDTDDRTIALGMKLPYLFTCENGVFLSGPMLQSAEWFNLYLNPIGFEMTEAELPVAQVPNYLKQQKTAMLGLLMENGSKHAVVCLGCRDNVLIFLNNKWGHTEEPEQLMLTPGELRDRLGATAMIATLHRISPRPADLAGRVRGSEAIIRANLSQIQTLCTKPVSVGLLRARLDTLFRPLLLDGITMLELLEERDLAQRFRKLQQELLRTLRQDPAAEVRLKDSISIAELQSAAEAYIQLIRKA